MPKAILVAGSTDGIGLETARMLVSLGHHVLLHGRNPARSDIRIGADVLRRAALADEFAAASGQYFDNDSGQFASPHPDALDPRRSQAIVRRIETVLAELMQSPEEMSR